MKARTREARRPEPATLVPGARFPLGAIEIETGPADGRRTIPPEVLAAILEIAEHLWFSEAQGWIVVDPEDIGVTADSIAKMLGNIVGDGGSLDAVGCALVARLAEEIAARTTAARGVNPKHYTVVLRDAVAS